MSQKIDRKLEGAELEYAKGAILYRYNNGQVFQYFMIGNQCFLDAALIWIVIKMVRILLVEFSAVCLFGIIFVGVFAAVLGGANFILIFQSDRKKRNEKVFANDITAYDVTLEGIHKFCWSKVKFIDGSTLKAEIKCHFYEIQPYKKGIIIKIMGDHDRPIAYDLIPEYIPGSKVDRIAKKELRRKKYNKYKRKISEV